MTERQRQKLEVDEKCIYYTEKPRTRVLYFYEHSSVETKRMSQIRPHYLRKNLERTSPSMVKPVTLKTVAPSLSVE